MSWKLANNPLGFSKKNSLLEERIVRYKDFGAKFHSKN